MKRNRIIYWIATGWLALGMTATGIVQLLHTSEEVSLFERLGYPTYLLSVLGLLKILGVLIVLLPKLPLLKEWAYAGFFFTMSGALASHAFSQYSAKAYFGPALLLALTILSWYYRPASRRASFTLQTALS